jgi:dTDP-glucose 4,6-dehydratase
MQKVLITGSGSFICENLIRKAIHYKLPYSFIGVDRVKNSLALSNLYVSKNYQFYIGNVLDEHFLDVLFEYERPDIVIHGAFSKGQDAIETNALGTQKVIDACLRWKTKRLIHLSTGKVYGSLSDENAHPSKENDLLIPITKFVASQAAAELLVQAAGKSQNLPYLIVRLAKGFGPRQGSYCFIPHTIKSILDETTITLYNQGLELRDWLHTSEICSALFTVLEKEHSEQVYNLSAGQEFSNLEIANHICNILGRGHHLISFTEKSDVGFRYSMDGSKLKSLDWTPKLKFKERLEKTVGWYETNRWALQ